jgi:hypothetical protein
MEMRSFVAELKKGDRSTAGFYDLAKRMFSTTASAIATPTGNLIHTKTESIICLSGIMKLNMRGAING